MSSAPSRSLFAMVVLFALACQTDRGGVLRDEPSPAVAVERTLSDSQIAGILEAVDQGEIDHARLAQERAQSEAVRQYAQLLVRDHKRSSEMLREVMQRERIRAASSPIRQELVTMARRVEEQLRRREGAEFDGAYIDAQIEQHRRSLDLIDNQLLPNAQSGALQRHLRQVRPVIANHLEAAQRVRDGQPLALH